MNTTRDPDTILAAWLDEGPTALPDVTRRAIVTLLPTTRRARHGTFSSRRSIELRGLGWLAATAVVAVVAIATTFVLVGPLSPAATPSPSPSTGTTDFSSPQYGYRVTIPASWVATAATQAWPGGEGIDGADAAYLDVFSPEGPAGTLPIGAWARVKARLLPAGTTSAEWLAQWESARTIGGNCFGNTLGAGSGPWTDATVAGLPARRFEWRCTNTVSADAPKNYDEYTFLAGGMGFVITGTPSMVAILTLSFQPPTPSPSLSVAASCGHQLVPTLLLNVGCTYGTTVFEHPLTVTLADQWLVGDETATAVSFRGYGDSMSGGEVRLIVLGSIADAGCLAATTPLPSSPLPRTADEYVAWLRGAAPTATGPATATVAGVPALKLTIPEPDADCLAFTLGSTAVAADGSLTAMECSGVPCTLFVIDDGGRVLLLETMSRAYGVGSDPRGVERFLGGLRFAP